MKTIEQTVPRRWRGLSVSLPDVVRPCVAMRRVAMLCLALPAVAMPAVVVSSFALLAVGCNSARETGGETHFLTLCDDSAEALSCGGEYDCVCGVCTTSCDESAVCGHFPAAECRPISDAAACSGSIAANQCDVPCSEDADCGSLSARHRCELGVCRGDAVAGGAAISLPSASGSELSDAGAEMTSCSGDDHSANELLIIGDSFFASSHQITASLEALARDAGALASNERYRDSSTVTGNGLAITDTTIADQYQAAVAEGDVSVVIMNGGGTDALLSECQSASDCPALDDAALAAGQLLAQMSDDGVLDVVYLFYPDPPEGDMFDRLDTLRPQMRGVCEDSLVPCHWLDLRESFAGHDDYLQPDGLIPTAAGAEVSAGQLWALMQRECIAQ